MRDDTRAVHMQMCRYSTVQQKRSWYCFLTEFRVWPFLATFTRRNDSRKRASLSPVLRKKLLLRKECSFIFTERLLRGAKGTREEEGKGGSGFRMTARRRNMPISPHEVVMGNFFLYNKDGSKNSLLSSLWMLAAGKILGSLRKLDVRVHHVRYLAINSVDQMAVYIQKVTLCHQISMELFSTFQLCVLVFRQLYCFWSISLVFFSATSDDRFQEPLKIV